MAHLGLGSTYTAPPVTAHASAFACNSPIGSASVLSPCSRLLVLPLNPAYSHATPASASSCFCPHRDTGWVGCTGPIMQASPPGLITRYASVIPRCGSGQYSMLPADT
jgi:hypothetical protein